MTDETNPPAEPNAEAARKAELIAEGAARNPPVKMDMRWSVKRMEETLGAPPPDGEASAVPAPEPAPAPVESPEVVALKAQLAEANAKLAAQPEPPVQPYNAPGGMLTSMNMGGHGTLAREATIEEDERRLLMDRAASLGIANEIRPGANNDTIREHIMRHVATKADDMRQREEADRLKALGPKAELVTIRVLKSGDGKISKGIHIPGVGDACYARNDLIPNVLRKDADHYENIGYAEIVGG